MGNSKFQQDLQSRTFNFAVTTIKFLRTIHHSKENDVIKYQLAKSATSIGANYEEAQSAYSRDEFKYKIGICLRETRESNYWLRIIKSCNIINSKDLDFLIQESTELRMIFSSIMKKIHYRTTRIKGEG